jgi:pimeloyl-ACP methyl ester carboxylesterase
VTSEPLESVPFQAERDGVVLRGDATGEGPAIVLAHGLTATRDVVVHGSRLLVRRGYRLLPFDARGHGESDPAPADRGYSYGELAADLGAVIDAGVGEGRAVLAGHSMGAHTIAAFALAHPDRVGAMVLIGPASLGTPPTEESLTYWDRLADGMASNGVEGFIAAYDVDLDPEWRETLLRIARQRLVRHRHPDAVAQALREVPRSVPFDGVAQLASLDIPALVVASHDEADPGHPYATAEAWASHLPQARLISEEPGESPLAWQGGKLSREIAAFCDEPAVRERLGPA